MVLMFEIHYHELVLRDDIPKLPHLWRERVKHAIELKLTTQPEAYGKPLRKSLKGYRKLRVGDYRIIFRIDGSIIKILVIAHRSRVYKISDKRN